MMQHPRTAHFIGIAGAGMSATAKLLRDSGVTVTGSDEHVYPPVSNFLADQALAYRTPYAAENIPAGVDLIVIGKNAKLVPETNPEVAAAIASGARIQSFPEVLADLTRDKETIVVAGAYGKSTTASLLVHCLESAAAQAGDRIDPSFFIGAIPFTPATSARFGRGDLFVLEGDEYPSSNTDSRSKFLHYHPRHLLLTPLAHDHVNVFPTPADYLRPFAELLDIAAPDATVVACLEGELSREFVPRIGRPVVTYGVQQGDFTAAAVRWGEKTRFTLVLHGSGLVEVETTQLGEHNVQNIVGVGAFLLTRGLVTPEQFAEAIVKFRGIRRRLDRKSDKTSIPIFEGFGSSYEKARSAIAAIKRHFPANRLIVLFEPHTFSWRNRNALAWYDSVFEGADRVFIYEPAAQGAATHAQLTHGEIVQRVARAGYDVAAISDPKAAQVDFANLLRSDDVVLMLTSGGLGGLIEQLPLIAEEKFPRPEHDPERWKPVFGKDHAQAKD
jgi:UDP-N-acetylmuramate: L-alanyl-gamma-D-glutamyl-meso-diaminopimelate ligase